MNIELLQEIKSKLANNESLTDIATSIGISKQNMLLMLRIEDVVSKRYIQEVNSLKEEQKAFKSALHEEYELKQQQFKKEYPENLSKNLDQCTQEKNALLFKINTLEEEIEELTSEIKFLETDINQENELPNKGFFSKLIK